MKSRTYSLEGEVLSFPTKADAQAYINEAGLFNAHPVRLKDTWVIRVYR